MGLARSCLDALMRWLIDGYNLMHAAGAAGQRELGREAFRRKRRQFLSTLAHAMGSERARATTIVFDATSPPADFEIETTYKELHLIFALGDESADARIEQLIASHSAPRSLTVVSTDRRVRRAALRRRATAVTADAFLDEIDRLRAARRRGRERPPQAPAPSATPDRTRTLSPEEAAFWMNAFADAAASEEANESLEPDAPLLTQDDIARIQREVDRES